MPSSDLHRHLIKVAPLSRTERQKDRERETQRGTEKEVESKIE